VTLVHSPAARIRMLQIGENNLVILARNERVFLPAFAYNSQFARLATE
jgi:hypothetical protein